MPNLPLVFLNLPYTFHELLFLFAGLKNLPHETEVQVIQSFIYFYERFLLNFTFIAQLPDNLKSSS